MKNATLTLGFCLTLLALPVVLPAQPDEPDQVPVRLTRAEMKKEAIATTMMLERFMKRITDMGSDSSVSMEEALNYVNRRILPNFEDTAFIEVSNLNRKTISRQDPKTYFRRLFTRSRREPVDISFSGVDVVEISPNLYIVKLLFLQRFKTSSYSDKTLKQVTIFFEPHDEAERTYKILIRSIEVMDTQR